MIETIANLVNLAILVAFLAYKLRKPVANILRKRTAKIQSQLAQAEEELANAIELRRQYEQKLEEVGQKREEILAEAHRLASETKERLIAEASKEAAAIKARAAVNSDMEWERAESEMRTTIIDVSSVMAENLVKLAINKDTHDRLFDETLADLEGMTWRD